MEIKENGVRVTIKTDTSEMDEVTRKAERLKEIMNEAMELANSIAKIKLNIPISAILDGNATELARVTAE